MRRNELIGRLLGADVTPCLLDVDAHLFSLGLNSLPCGHVQVGDFHGARQEQDRETFCALLIGLLQQPLAHHKSKRAITSRDGDDLAFAGHRELLVRSLVLLGGHLPGNEAALVHDADGVVAEAPCPENLRGHLRPELLGILGCIIHVDVLDVALLQFLPGRVAMAEQVPSHSDFQPLLVVDLGVLLEGAAGQNDEFFRRLVVPIQDLAQMEKGQGQRRILLDDIGDAVGRRRVQAARKDDDVPSFRPDNLLHAILVELVRILHELLGTCAAVRGVLEDLLADAHIVREDEDALLRRLRRLRQLGGPLLGLHETVEGLRHNVRLVDQVLKSLVQGIALLVLQWQLFVEPLNRKAHLTVAIVTRFNLLGCHRRNLLVIPLRHGTARSADTSRGGPRTTD
mmetsp:Transcript_102796/g.257893  ORF Transcript_102796/g.257893 Transcript_102796/m.257893 type:complete len:398 (+) Transcript_102796:831-2024(+)